MTIAGNGYLLLSGSTSAAPIAYIILSVGLGAVILDQSLHR